MQPLFDRKAIVIASAFLMVLFLSFLAGCGSQPSTSPLPAPSIKPTDFQSAAPVMSGSGVFYSNTKYGFTFDLPEAWKGYSIIEQKWEGTAAGASKAEFSGAQILIRNPSWTEKEPTQDIPIMVLTLKQWNDLEQEKFHIGAAPINPSELGRNSRYVFALPARYNYAFLKGFEEVEKIFVGKALKPTE